MLDLRKYLEATAALFYLDSSACVSVYRPVNQTLISSSRPLRLLRDNPYVHGPTPDLRKKNVILELEKILEIMFPESPFARKAKRPREYKARCSEIRGVPVGCPFIAYPLHSALGKVVLMVLGM